MRVYFVVIGFYRISPLAHWAGNRPERIGPVMFLFIVPTIVLVVSIASGWWGLSLTYKTERTQPANRRTGGASFRYVMSYNNVLRMGSDREGLYLTSWVRLFHPPLFIPWSDVEVGEPKRMLFQRYRGIRLGLANRVPFSIDGKTADRLLRERDGCMAVPEQRGCEIRHRVSGAKARFIRDGECRAKASTYLRGNGKGNNNSRYLRDDNAKRQKREQRQDKGDGKNNGKSGCKSDDGGIVLRAISFEL